MAVLDNYPFISGALDLFLAFHRLVFLLAVYQLSEIDLVIEYHSDRCYVPVEVLAPVVRLVVIGVVLIKVGYRCKQLFLSEDLGHTVVADSLCSKSEYASDRFSGRLVNNKVVAVFGVKLVAKRRTGAYVLPFLCFGSLCGLGLF